MNKTPIPNTSNMLGNDEIFIPVDKVLNHIFHLSGKIYTLLEATITNEKQAEALKDVVRGYVSHVALGIEEEARNENNYSQVDHHAILTIYDYPNMHKIDIDRLAEWLETKAKEVRKEDKKQYSNMYNMRLMK